MERKIETMLLQSASLFIMGAAGKVLCQELEDLEALGQKQFILEWQFPDSSCKRKAYIRTPSTTTTKLANLRHRALYTPNLM